MVIKNQLSGDLKLGSLPHDARHAHVFKDLHKWSLLSVGKLCDSVITVIFTSDKVKAILDGNLVLDGNRSAATDWLWTVDITPPIVPGYALNVYPTGSIAKLVTFYHGCLCSPPISTFLLILDLGLKLPGITRKDILKYPPITAAEAAGHLDGTRFRTLSKSRRPNPPTDQGSEGEETPDPPLNLDEEDVVATRTIEVFDDTCHEVLMGKYPIPSLRGGNYLIVMYSNKTKYIHGKIIKNREGPNIAKGYNIVFDFFLRRNVHTKFLHMDNETSLHVEKLITD